VIYLLHIQKAPAYLAPLSLRHQSVLVAVRLRSASSFRYELPRMRQSNLVSAVSHMRHQLPGTLPPSLQQLTNTDSFKRQLKTVVLFERDFS